MVNQPFISYLKEKHFLNCKNNSFVFASKCFFKIILEITIFRYTSYCLIHRYGRRNRFIFFQWSLHVRECNKPTWNFELGSNFPFSTIIHTSKLTVLVFLSSWPFRYCSELMLFNFGDCMRTNVPT